MLDFIADDGNHFKYQRIPAMLYYIHVWYKLHFGVGVRFVSTRTVAPFTNKV